MHHRYLVCMTEQLILISYIFSYQVQHFFVDIPSVNLCVADCCVSLSPGYDWILLSPCYVQTDGDVAGWRELFSKLGIKDGLIICKQRQTLTATELVRTIFLNCYLS